MKDSRQEEEWGSNVSGLEVRRESKSQKKQLMKHEEGYVMLIARPLQSMPWFCHNRAHRG